MANLSYAFFPHIRNGTDHKLKVRKVCPEDKKGNVLLQMYVEEKSKAKKAQGYGSELKRKKQSFVVFSMIFGQRHRPKLCMHIGADGEIIDDRNLHKVLNAGKDITVDLLQQLECLILRAVAQTGRKAQLICKKTVSADAETRVTHGLFLLVRNLSGIIPIRE